MANKVDRKVKSKSMGFPKGGGDKMVGKQSAGPGKWPKGGGNKMVGRQKAGKAKAC